MVNPPKARYNTIMHFCPYAALNITSDASKQEITLAYRKLALKYHPDLNPTSYSSQKFIEINNAYRTLMSLNRSSTKVRPNASLHQSRPHFFQSIIKPKISKIYNNFKTILTEDIEDLNVYTELKVCSTQGRGDIIKDLRLEITDYLDDGKTVVSEKQLKVSIPKDTKSGSYLRIKGMGSSSHRQEKKGDLMLKVLRA